MSRIEKKLTKEWADEIIREDKRLISAIIYDLQEMGKAIAAELNIKDYESFEMFLLDHESGMSPFNALEGKADCEDNLFVLNHCPMAKMLESVMVDGKLPDFYQRIVDKYTEIHKGKGAILHPFCIVHQVIRATVCDHIKVKGKPLKVYQVACRSMSSGKVVFAMEGTTRTEMDQDAIRMKIGGKACMYILKP